VAIRRSRRGRRQQIRTITVLDAVWPRAFDPVRLLTSLAGAFSGEADMIALQGRRDFWNVGDVYGTLERSYGAPRTWFSKMADGTRLAELARLMPADGDTMD
jgi:hypothetical protein